MLCIWYWILLFAVPKKLSKNIKNIIGILKKYPPESLNASFEQLNEQLLQDPFISHFWSEFTETLIRIKKPDGDEELYNSIDANYFFNEENLINRKFNIRFYKAVPGILTGLGILGTFVGLTFGLSQINLGTSDVNVLKEGVANLLSGASMAFSTSVWGIGLSICFLLFKRCQLNALSGNVSDLQNNIDRIFIHKTPEDLLSDVLWETRQQTSELKRFNEDLAINIATALDEKLAVRLTPTFEKLLVAIEELTQTGTSQVAKVITEGAGKEIENLKDTLGMVGKTLQNTVSQSQETQERVTETFNKFLNTLTERQDGFTTNIQKAIDTLVSKTETTSNRATEAILHSLEHFSKDVSDLVNKLGQETTNISQQMQGRINELTNLIRERMEEVSNQFQTEQAQLRHLLNQLNTTLKHTEDIVEGAGLAAEAFAQTAVPIKGAIDKLFQTVQDVQKSHETFKETLYNTQDLLKQYSLSMEKSVAYLLESAQKTQLAWRAYEDKFGVIKEDLEAVFEEMRRGLQDYVEITGRNVGEILSKFDQHLSEAIKHLGGVVEELQEKQEEIYEGIEQLRKFRITP